MADESGFFNRWSRLKAQSQQDPAAPVTPQAAEPPAHVSINPPPTPPCAAGGAAQLSDASLAEAPRQAPAHPEPAEHEQPGVGWPTMEDVRQLTPDADFSRFVAPGTSADVRNAAMKKLFSNPFFNQMDGLDTYIDDYSQPDPLPLSLARKLASAQFMRLFDEPADKPATDALPAEPTTAITPASDPATSDVPTSPERPPSASEAT